MSRAGNLEENPVLALELDLLAVDPPRQIHGAVRRNELFPGELRSRFTLRARLSCHVNEDSGPNTECGMRKSVIEVRRRALCSRRLPRSGFRIRLLWHPICFLLTHQGVRGEHEIRSLHFLRHHPWGCGSFGVL